MNQERSQQLVIGCLAASAAIAAGNAVAEGQAPEARQIVGFAFAGIGLATLSMFAPGLAGGMAALVLTTSVFVYGAPLYDAVTDATEPPTTAGRRGRQTKTKTKTPREVVNA